jgi:hypothetical protein
MADPVGDAERAKLGKISIVEDQYKVTRLLAEALQHMAVAAGEVPHIARVEIIHFGVAARIDHGGADASCDNERPFRRGGVPVQLAHRAWLKPH